MGEQDLAKFKSFYDGYRPLWRSVEIRALFALKGQDWVALKTMAYLKDYEPQQYGYEVTFDALNIRAIVERKKVDAVSELVEQVRNGKVKVGDTQGSIGDVSPKDESFGFLMSESRSGRPPEPLFPYFTLYLSLGSVNSLVDENEINRTLYSYGYRGGLQELSAAKIGEPVGGTYNAYFGVVAPLYLLIAVENEPGYLRIAVRCGQSVEPGDVTLRCELYGKTELERIMGDWLTFSNTDRLQKEEGLFLVRQIATPATISSGRLTVFYREMKPPADSFNILRGGARASIINVLGVIGSIQDKGSTFETISDRLTKWLGVEQRALDSDRFEIAVWALLTLSGLQTISLGKVFGKGFDLPGIDLLAFHEASRRIILISCTIENRLSAKIEPLLQHSSAVKDKMQGWSVKPAIFAPIERRDVTLGSFLDATEAGVALVLRAEIAEVLGTVGTISADAATQVIESLWQPTAPSFLTQDVAQAYKLWLGSH